MFRKLLLLTLTVALMAVLLPPGSPALAQGPAASGTAISNLNVRTGPGQQYPSIWMIDAGVWVVIEARNNVGDWVLIHSADGTMRGWVASRYLIWEGQELASMPVVEDTLGMNIPANTPGMTQANLGAATEAANAQAISVTLMRQGPTTGYPTLTMLPRGANLVAEARDEAVEYLLAHTADGQYRGWLIRNHLQITEPENLPVSGEVLSNDAVYQTLLARLEAVPVLPSFFSERTRQIYLLGRQNGMNPRIFSKLGDCQTDHLGFMLPYGVGEYSLGEYDYLQASIDYFSVSPRHGVENSFVNQSMAALSAFSAAAILDPVWSNPGHCQPGETPLTCEYRLISPAVAIVMFGSVDIQIYNVDTFAFHLREIVKQSIDRGIIPVLSTFPSSGQHNLERTVQFNAVVLDIAAEEQVPLMNLWIALRDLPNEGLAGDDYHLSFSGDRFIDLSSDATQWGFSLRNLLVLQVLDLLRQQVLL